MRQSPNQKASEAQRQKREELRQLLPKGSTVYLIQRHRSRGGTKTVEVVLLPGIPDLPVVYLRAELRDLLGYRLDHDRGGVVTKGAAEDVVYHLARELYGASTDLRAEVL